MPSKPSARGGGGGRGAKRQREQEEEIENERNSHDGVKHFLTFKSGSSNKFYEISVAGLDVLCRYGRAESAGVTTVKSFAEESSQNSFIAQVLKEKVKKGYTERAVALQQADIPEKGMSQISKKKKITVQKEEDEDGDEKEDIMVDAVTDDADHVLSSPDPIGVQLVQSKHKNMSNPVRVAVDLESDEPYAAMLVMPATTGGKDKFYNIQLFALSPENGGDGEDHYYVFSRWGQVGDEGHTELSSVHKTLSLATEAFKQRFKIKTANLWQNRATFRQQSFHFVLGRAGYVRGQPTDSLSTSSTATAFVTAKKSSALLPSSASGDNVVRVVYLECREGSADKFYELKQTATHKVTIRYGRRLTGGVTSDKTFATAAEARSFVDKTAIAKQRKGYSTAIPPNDSEQEKGEAEGGAEGGGGEEATGDPAIDIENGHRVFVQGGSKLPYTLKKFQGGYSCTCRGWVGQIRIKGVQASSCKHLKAVRGEENEAARCQSSAGVVANPSSNKNKNPSIVSRISLAAKWKPSIDPTGYLMSEKLDGMRAYWCGNKLWTRSGLPIVTPEWFTEGFPAHVELDGELFLGRKMFDECMSITRRTDASEDWKKIKYVVFDAPKVAGGIGARLEAATAALAKSGNAFATVHPHTVCEGEAHLIAELATMEQLGGEGLMLRNATATHRGGRNVDLLKVKSFHDDEAIVTDYEAGKGKYEGMVGSLVCRSRHGAAFKVGSGLVDSQRSYQSKALPPVGSVITFQYFELTKDGIPRFPTFLRIRPDVDAADFN